VHVYYHYTTPR